MENADIGAIAGGNEEGGEDRVANGGAGIAPRVNVAPLSDPSPSAGLDASAAPVCTMNPANVANVKAVKRSRRMLPPAKGLGYHQTSALESRSLPAEVVVLSSDALLQGQDCKAPRHPRHLNGSGMQRPVHFCTGLSLVRLPKVGPIRCGANCPPPTRVPDSGRLSAKIFFNSADNGLCLQARAACHPVCRTLGLEVDRLVLGRVAEGVHRILAALNLVDVLELLTEEGHPLIRDAEPLEIRDGRPGPASTTPSCPGQVPYRAIAREERLSHLRQGAAR